MEATHEASKIIKSLTFESVTHKVSHESRPQGKNKTQ